jgi:pyridoxamine 5'-phosphate oxidase
MTRDFSELSERISSMQRDQLDAPLDREHLNDDPYVQFAAWLDEALAARPSMPNVMTLATADAEGVPSARTVLLKGFDGSGFVFFTNYESRKGRELDANPSAALVFYWPELHRQVSIAGHVIRVETSESDEYFASRPYESKLGAWASKQSTVIPDREELERRVRVAAEEFPDEIPRPPYWGGFRLTPLRFEFWQGRSDRLHDRFRYRRDDTGWVVERLAP